MVLGPRFGICRNHILAKASLICGNPQNMEEKSIWEIDKEKNLKRQMFVVFENVYSQPQLDCGFV